MDRVLGFAGALLSIAAFAVLAQRQRVLHRRLRRLELAVGIRRPGLAPAAAHRTPRGQQWVHPVRLPAPSDRPPKPHPRAVRFTAAGTNSVATGPRSAATEAVTAPRPLPTVQHLARLARPLSRAGG